MNYRHSKRYTLRYFLKKNLRDYPLCEKDATTSYSYGRTSSTSSNSAPGKYRMLIDRNWKHSWETGLRMESQYQEPAGSHALSSEFRSQAEPISGGRMTCVSATTSPNGITPHYQTATKYEKTQSLQTYAASWTYRTHITRSGSNQDTRYTETSWSSTITSPPQLSSNLPGQILSKRRRRRHVQTVQWALRISHQHSLG